MELQDVIKTRRAELGLTLDQVASACGVGKSIVAKWERGEVKNIRRDNLASLSDVLRVSPLVLMGREELYSQNEEYVPDGFIPMPDMASVPLVGRIACGEPITAEQNVEGVVSVPSQWRSDFALLCKGDSMEPSIKDGDLVAIHIQPMVENGEVAAVRIDNEATLKHVYLYPNYIELRPENPAYQSIIKIGEEMNEVKIEGKAVGLCRGM